MKKNTLRLFLFAIFVCTGVFLSGCNNQKIIFNRESQAGNLINKFSNRKEVPKTNSGIIILKDDEKKQENIKFGPSDINFDILIKFK